MPRPRKQKLICSLPRCSAFGPSGSAHGSEVIRLSIEEFETIRLIDHKNLDQALCAQQMGVARSTVQRLYTDARHKIALCLVEGRALIISGGDYALCENHGDENGCDGCRRQHRHRRNT